MNAIFLAIRLIFCAYLLVGPFIFIYLQQSLFKASFDDKLGNQLVVRLYLITVVGIISLFLLTLGWQYCDGFNCSDFAGGMLCPSR